MARSDKKNNSNTGKKKASGRQISAETTDKQQQIRDLQDQRNRDRRILDAIWGVTLLAFGIFLVVTTQLNTTGAFGDAIHSFVFGMFGVMAYVLPYYFIILALCLFFKKVQHINGRTTFFSILIFLMLCILNSYRFLDEGSIDLSISALGEFYQSGLTLDSGGVLGMWLGGLIVRLIGKPGLIILALSLIVISLLLVANTPISKYVAGLREKHEEKAILREMMEEERKKNESIAPQSSTLDILASDPAFASAEDNGISILSPVRPENNLVNVKNRGTAPLDLDFSAKNKNSAAAKVSDSAVSFATPATNVSHADNNQGSDFMQSLQDMGFGRDSENEYSHSPASYGLDGVSASHSTGYGLDGGAYPTEPTSYDSIPILDSFESIGTDAFAGTMGADTYAGSNAGASDTNSYGMSAFEDAIGRNSAAESEVNGRGEAAFGGENIAAGDNISSEEVAPSQLSSSEVKKMNTPSAADDEAVRRQVEAAKSSTSGRSYRYPSVELLKKPKGTQIRMSDQQLEERAALLERTLQNFHVDAHVINVTQGSSITRYEIQPAIGVKVSSITKLADDIALNMRAKSIRIEAPIPGKAAVGIEVENEKPAMVSIRELIDSKEFRQAKSKISFVVGKDISGRNVVANLKDMPHLLIAGATGSGKSVCINAIITSLLYKASPDEVRLILIDPKVVELGNYNGIPHLLIPVVTDPKKAASALNWAVNEMTQRYKLFAEEGVKDLDSYNELVRANQEEEKVLPKVVIIIDELADLMMAAPSQVEEAICRLAQLARAAGMHLIVATQRPSVDIVTGLIKANIPSRIAFSVSSQFDSRTILDVGGAEKLLGKGDMLYSPVGENKPIRIQGPYISDSEISKVITFVKTQGDAAYDEDVIQTIETPEGTGPNAGSDELTDDAIAFILKQQKASVSMLQRRFRIGYNRAANIVDEIERRGIISPADGSKPRQVLYTENDYYNAIDQKGSGTGKEADE